MKWLNLSKRSDKLIAGMSFSWPEMTPQDWLMEIISLAGIVTMLCYIIYHYPKLPASVPDHFDFQGNPETFADRNQVWMMPGISIFLYFMLPAVMRLRMSTASSRFLRRVKTQRQFNGRVRLLRFQKMIFIWGLLYISVSLVQFSLHSGNGLGQWFLPVFLSLLIIPSVSYLLFLKQNG
ncbi:MAG: DUF1648 domain-containing protein [Bacteroidetes bacterium]|nr:DUF1648 domain-containing protein [Bacteroidota bacterium]